MLFCVPSQSRVLMVAIVFQYLYIVNKCVGKESAHLCSFLKELVLWALRCLL